MGSEDSSNYGQVSQPDLTHGQMQDRPLRAPVPDAVERREGLRLPDDLGQLMDIYRHLHMHRQMGTSPGPEVKARLRRAEIELERLVTEELKHARPLSLYVAPSEKLLAEIRSLPGWTEPHQASERDRLKAAFDLIYNTLLPEGRTCEDEDRESFTRDALNAIKSELHRHLGETP